MTTPKSEQQPTSDASESRGGMLSRLGKNQSRSQLFKQMLRFSVVGCTAFIIDFGLLWILTEFAGINYLVSSAISFTASVIYNYILSILWVFDVGEDHSKIKDFIIFVVLSVIGLGINQLIMYAMVELLLLYYLLAKIIATAVVTVYNFITRKVFLEK